MKLFPLLAAALLCVYSVGADEDDTPIKVYDAVYLHGHRPPKNVVMEEEPNVDCDLSCTKLELNPVCATRGGCLHEFANQCVMDIFNCQHPRATFVAIDSKRCLTQMDNKCTEEDMLSDEIRMATE